VRLIPTAIPGCIEVQPHVFDDARGRFAKPYHAPTFAANGIDFRPAEAFFTLSHRRVLRGFHFQVPPHDHVKLVYCASGAVLDVVVDVRCGSPVFGMPFSAELDAKRSNALLIPRGVGHAFYVRSEEAVLAYLVSTPHAPSFDAGVRWDSAGVDWPDAAPVISQRDRALPTLEEFRSPFLFDDGTHR
jgi:dTDP-4-dehydrorhamnose 3,5-epimerase